MFFRRLSPRLVWLVVPLVAMLLFVGPLLHGQVLVPGDILPFVDDIWHSNAPVQNPLLSDVLFQFYPWQSFLFQQLQAGVWPLWNPFQLAGTPFLANHQSAPFDVVRLVTFGLGFSAAGSFLPGAILRLTLFGLFTARWLRRRGFSDGLAVMLASTAMLAAPNIVWISYPLFAVCMWLPVVLYGIEVLPTKWWAGIGWIALGTVGHIFGGNVQMSLFIILFSGAYAAVVFSRHRWRLRAKVLAGVLIGLGLSAVQLLPTLAFVRQSSVYDTGRSGYARTSVMEAIKTGKWTGWHSRSDVKREFILLMPTLVPEVFGNPATNSYRFPEHKAQNNFNELAGSVGLAAVWLALFGALTAWRERIVKFFAISAGIMLGMVAHAPVFELLNYLPLVRQTSTGRLRFLTAFALVGLAASGVRILFQSSHSRQRFWVIVTGLFVLVPAAGLLTFSPVIPSAARLAGFLWLGFIALGVAVVSEWKTRYRPRVGILGAVLILPSLWLFHSYNPGVDPKTLFPSTPAVQAARSLAGSGRVVGISELDRRVPLRPNGAMVFQLPDIRGYEVVRLHRFEQLTDGLFLRLGSYLIAVDQPDRRLNLLGVRAGILAQADMRRSNFLEAGWAEGASVGQVSILTNPAAFPRTFFISHPRQAGSPAAALAIGRTEVQSPAETVVETGVDQAASDAQIQPATMVAEDPNRVVIRVDAPAAGYVVLNDAYDAGWKAAVDGHDAQVVPANYAFRAVAVASGKHEVIFQYRPTSFMVGRWVSLGVAVLILTGGIFFIIRLRSRAAG